jgi:hypothetical protein
MRLVASLSQNRHSITMSFNKASQAQIGAPKLG